MKKKEAEKIIHEIEKAIIELRNGQYGISLEDGKKLTDRYFNDMCDDDDNFRFEWFHNQELIIGGMKSAITIIKKQIK
tara:strand:+ start:208 stop:441 length:234 start_codon:yes stop_codon:yes gene_type:complete